MWYHTELMAISKNQRPQNQKVSLRAKPTALSGAHYLLSGKKKNAGRGCDNGQRTVRSVKESQVIGPVNTTLLWSGRGPASRAMRAGLDAKEGGIHPFLLQIKCCHGSSAGKNSKLLTNHGISLKLPHGALGERGWTPVLTFTVPPNPTQSPRRGTARVT